MAHGFDRGRFGWILTSFIVAALVTAVARSLVDAAVFSNEGLAELAGRFGPGVRPRIEVTGAPVCDRLQVRVGDNGLGIPPDKLERVLETFQRVHEGDYRGTGLGLSIRRCVVTRHSGEIWVDARGTSAG